jgi:squalene cyclase
MRQGWLQAHNCVTAAAADLKWFNYFAIPYLADKQQEGGYWKGYWWYDEEYATGLATEAIAHSQIIAKNRIIELATSWVTSKVQ